MTHPGYRDAIHVPYIMVTCSITLRDDYKCVRWCGSRDEPDWHGVADPFRENDLPAGELFAVYIRKECFSELRHDFTIEVNDHGGTDTCHSVCNVF